MKFVILAIGTRGDVQPLVALGRGLLEAGHAVRFVTHSIFRPLVERGGLEFYAVQSDPLNVLETEQGQKALAHGSTPWRTWKGLSDSFKSDRQNLGDECLEASRGADVLCVSTLSFLVGGSIAEALELPVIPLFLQPVSATREFPSLFFAARRFSPRINLLSYRLAALAFWIPFKKRVNRWRTEQLGLDPVGARYLLERQARTDRPMVYGFSHHLIPRPADWGAHIHLTGFWFLERHAEWQPPAALRDFLAAGPPPVYVGFGSMINSNRASMTADVIRALQISGQRGVLQAGWGQLAEQELPDNMLRIDYAPHDWLFPRMSMIIHHGGAGTTASALRAGRPSVVVPFTADQPFWGQRVAAIGAGPAPIPCKKLNADNLAEAIERVMGDHSMREKAAQAGVSIGREDGVQCAVSVIEQYLKNLP